MSKLFQLSTAFCDSWTIVMRVPVVAGAAATPRVTNWGAATGSGFANGTPRGVRASAPGASNKAMPAAAVAVSAAPRRRTEALPCPRAHSITAIQTPRAPLKTSRYVPRFMPVS